MVTIRRQALTLVLCLLLRKVHSQFTTDDEYTVDGTAQQSATLPCSLTLPSNWKGDEFHVIWFINFTEKLWDCTMKSGKAPNCWMSPKSSSTQISRNIFGNFDLEISVLQESDAGRYQCWIIMLDSYIRRDVLLRVHRLRSHTLGKDNSTVWRGSVLTPSSWTVFLLSGWLFAIFLAGVLLCQRLSISKRKTQFIVRA